MYTAKTLFTGYKLGLKDTHRYVAIPEKCFKNGLTEVKYQNEIREFKKTESKFTQTFDDKFRIGKTYTLIYFRW